MGMMIPKNQLAKVSGVISDDDTFFFDLTFRLIWRCLLGLARLLRWLSWLS
jgi:hypothetical protein